MEATVAERGQITLPKAVRDALGLTKGTKLKVELEGGRIVLRKDVGDALSRLRGRFRLAEGFTSTDDALRAIRLFASRIADAIQEGRQIGTEGGVIAPQPVEEEAGEDQIDIAATLAKAGLADPDDDDTVVEEEEEAVSAETDAAAEATADEAPTAETAAEESNEAAAS